MKQTLRNKKGFTLVELLVVIVIMAILAAILIPTFSKYVTKAENATVVAEARAAHVAASVLVQEAAIKEKVKGGAIDNTKALAAVSTTELANLTDVTGAITAIKVSADGTVEGFIYATPAATPTKWVKWVKAAGQYEVSKTALILP